MDFGAGLFNSVSKWQSVRLSALFLFCLLFVGACADQEKGVSGSTASATNGDRLLIAGSSTVAPFLSSAAEYFSAVSDFPIPVVETTGTGGGFKLFCQSAAANSVSIAMASRPISSYERDVCSRNGVTQFIELEFGFDGIVLARSVSSDPFALTRSQIYSALAENVQSGDRYIENPYLRWSDVGDDLPNAEIEVFGPPTTSGTRDSFVSLAMLPGARSGHVGETSNKLNEEEFRRRAEAIRTDGAWINAGENDTQIVRYLLRNPQAVGIVGFSFFDQSRDKLDAISIDGALPSVTTIVNGDYALSRALYLYVKTDHLATQPALTPFLREVFSREAMGDGGYLVAKGLIPRGDDEISQTRQRFEQSMAEASVNGPKQKGQAL